MVISPLGPPDAPILLYAEVDKGVSPFIGRSGGLLNRLFSRLGWDRDNILMAVPQEGDAEILWSPKVVLAMGSVAVRKALDLPKRDFKLENWHGCPSGRIVPTFHLSHALKKPGMTGALLFDMQVAQTVQRGTWRQQPAELIVDPPAEWFSRWVSEFLLSPSSWLAVDIETPQKLKSGKDEGKLEEDPSFEIIRINFAFNPDQGITVPWAGPYLFPIRKLLALAHVCVGWNLRYDSPRLKKNGAPILGMALDFMNAWHLLQSDLPKGLGFVSPFYSSFGAWKHLSGTDPGTYAAIDAIQTLRCARGIARDLEKGGQWEIFLRHFHDLDTLVLHPAEEVGLPVDEGLLDAFGVKLEGKKKEFLEKICSQVPPEVRELHPKKGWKKNKIKPFAVTYRRGKEKLIVQYQLSDLRELEDRWFVESPFNPASNPQLLSYMAWKGDKGGKAKGAKTDAPSTNKLVLESLARKNPFYQDILNFRAVTKVKGTYVDGAKRLLKADKRLHPSFLHTPSTFRLSCVGPNLQNVVADRDQESLAAGFKDCIVAP